MRRGYLIAQMAAGLLAAFSIGCDQSPPPTATPVQSAPHVEKPSAGDSYIAARVSADPKAEANRVPSPGEGQGGGKWVTLKGQVLLPEEAVKAIGEKKPINVTANPEHCLSKGPLMPEDVIVNPKTRGIQNVVVWLRPANNARVAPMPPDSIHPDLAAGKYKSKNLVIDQPCCQFVPRITLGREGDTLEVKNSSPINHNTKWSSSENGEFNVNIAPGQSYKLPNPLKFERTQIPFECSSHPWMKGQVRVFDHPYFALTDADGKFEIKNAPAGTFHIVYAHENGFHKGADGRFGWPIEIKDAGNGTMELKPLEYEFPKN
jgi:hypothetical protein